MSTKTTFKRIALVAVAALGLGVLSVVPSQAAVLDLALPVATNGNPTLTSQDTRTAGSITVSAFLEGGTADSVTVQIFEKSVPSTSSGTAVLFGYLETTTAGTIVDNTAIAAGTPTIAKYESVTATSPFYLTRASAGSVGAKFTVQLETGTGTIVAGSYVYTVIAKPASAGVVGAASTWVTKDVTLTIAAAPVAATPVPAAGNAKAYLQAGTSPTFTGVLADSVTVGSLLAGTVVGQIQVSNFTSADAVASDTITVKMTGVGYLTTVSPTTTIVTGREFTLLNEDVAKMSVIADGSSGTGTITITTEKGASFVKTVTFFDQKPSKAVAKVEKAYIKAGTGEVADVFSVVVTDAAGTAVTDAVVTATVTDAATTVGGAATCGTYDTTENVYYCAVAGLSTTKFGPVAYTIKATGANAAKTVVTTSATVTFADNVATKAVLAGPASGAPGAAVEYTITLTEKNGYPVADDVYGVGNANGGVLFATRVASGWTTAPFATTDSFTSVSGVITSKGTLPLAGTATGTWTLVGDGLQTLAADAIDKTIGKTKITATTEVVNAAADAATAAAEAAEAAAQDATDAALDATTAAEAAGALAQEAVDAVAELSAEVTKLMAGVKAQITYLTKLVMRLAAK